jgi:2-isopropylmalate synthase
VTADNRPSVSIYDATLRDGAQAAGISFSGSGKLRFARRLDEFGVDFIEGGYAGSNEKDMQFFRDIRRETLSHTKITAFGSTRRPTLDVAKDPFVASLLQADTEVCTIYGKSWKLHVADVLRTTEANNEQMIADTVGYLRDKGRRVFFDAEHFFDGYKDDAAFALRMLQAAIREGAEGVILCDTNGGCLPHEIGDITRTVVTSVPASVFVGIHAHNDGGVGVANTLEAVRVGATQVQGCMNGYGERTGNANLTVIIPNLELKMGYRCVRPGALKNLRGLSLFVDDMVNQRPDFRAPFVGQASFTHKAGAHVAGVQKNPHTFEHVDPTAVGNERQILLSEVAGGANVQLKVQQLGGEYASVSRDDVRPILDELKRLESLGYSFESADGSFRILVQKSLKKHRPFFELDAFRVIVEKRNATEPCISEATVKVRVNGEVAHTVGEGNGPVDALDHALRKALAKFYPAIANVALSDFNVRILDPQEATAAMTRVLIESGDGERTWGTVGVSRNIIEASWEALVDSVEYKLFADEEAAKSKGPTA